MAERMKNFLDWVNAGWAPLVGVVALVFWFGGLAVGIETDQEKNARIDLVVGPLRSDISDLSDDVKALRQMVYELHRDMHK